MILRAPPLFIQKAVLRCMGLLRLRQFAGAFVMAGCVSLLKTTNRNVTSCSVNANMKHPLVSRKSSTSRK